MNTLKELLEEEKRINILLEEERKKVEELLERKKDEIKVSLKQYEEELIEINQKQEKYIESCLRESYEKKLNKLAYIIDSLISIKEEILFEIAIKHYRSVLE